MTFKYWNKNQKYRKDRRREQNNIQKTTRKSILEADNLGVGEDHRRQVVKPLKRSQYYSPKTAQKYSKD